MLSEDSYLLEGPKNKVTNAPTFTRNGSHCHVRLLLIIKIKICNYHLCKRQSADINVRIGRYCLIPIIGASVVLSQVDYCNSSLAGLHAIALAPLERLLNAATHYVADLRPCNHVKSVLHSLHQAADPSAHTVQTVYSYVPCRSRVCTRLHYQSGYTDISYVGPITSSLCQQPHL